MEQLMVDNLVEKIAMNNRIASFYPNTIAKITKLPMKVVIERLEKLSLVGYIEKKYEIRCNDDLELIKIINNCDNIIGKYIYCNGCDEEVEISLDNINIVYYVCEDYRLSLKKKVV